MINIADIRMLQVDFPEVIHVEVSEEKFDMDHVVTCARLEEDHDIGLVISVPLVDTTLYYGDKIKFEEKEFEVLGKKEKRFVFKEIINKSTDIVFLADNLALSSMQDLMNKFKKEELICNFGSHDALVILSKNLQDFKKIKKILKDNNVKYKLLERNS